MISRKHEAARSLAGAQRAGDDVKALNILAQILFKDRQYVRIRLDANHVVREEGPEENGMVSDVGTNIYGHRIGPAKIPAQAEQVLQEI